MNKKRFIYICSPLKGDFKRNIDRAIKYPRFVYDDGFITLAPHIIFTQFRDRNKKV